ncbi:NAD(P)-binding domain-containing protein [Streptomyces niveiscabiei]|uniref:NADPH-dependent F420 reductase n=1 Tax=Streptomyces niveiscabiei TaxID=164115 RepID=UPI0029A45473|nr:NAD(P)-binding domain-containing protein [Streptomyces niveiscabiei]MDX3383293.1 NAD(P)-binding domain-containing protein [Streptomyces niveiscabiei]
MPRTLGLIGSGNIGTAVARLAVAAGWNVVLSNSRGPETLAGLVADLGEKARAATPAQAARAGDLVVATVPLYAYDKLPVDALDGKTVLDTLNYYPARDGQLPELDANDLTSSALVQRQLPGSRVVKVFNNIGAHQLVTLARPAGAPDRSALPIAGDDPGAKKETADLLDALGWDAVDVGSLAESWRVEPESPVYVKVYAGEAPEGLSPLEWFGWAQQNPGVTVPADRVRELVESAVRGPAGGVVPKGTFPERR